MEKNSVVKKISGILFTVSLILEIINDFKKIQEVINKMDNTTILLIIISVSLIVYLYEKYKEFKRKTQNRLDEIEKQSKKESNEILQRTLDHIET
ncbi:MAG TPA: hypothetical protein VEF33_08955 [Syntrophales bacterium]|nr:hypothetical protein [Syntrophales bacterium]